MKVQCVLSLVYVFRDLGDTDAGQVLDQDVDTSSDSDSRSLRVMVKSLPMIVQTSCPNV